mmetsp:Transcript_103076/g.177906  ORF Transcript_103076/g.177906 Transcript_103076/m.177906 type:complete len:1211 (+) Transcript_103076:60-3692(+)
MAQAQNAETVLNNCSLSEIFSQKRCGSCSTLPAPCSPAWFGPQDRSWYSQKNYLDCSAAEKRKLVPCTLLVEFSPTSRAKCRRCGEIIEKDTLRFGYPFQYSPREDPYSNYLHLDCYVPEVFGIKVSDPKELRKKVLGFDALSNTEQAQVKRAMSGGKRRGSSSKAEDITEELESGGVGPAEKVRAVAVPKELRIPLLPFQKEGLAWLCRQEDKWEQDPSKEGGNCAGGILADEMGMGKTVQMVSLLLARRREEAPALVVVPVAALQQWVSEIDRYTRGDALNVLVYHGTTKKSIAKDFKNNDVVLTTYQTLEHEFRGQMDKLKVACKYCGKLFLPEKLAIHQRYFCGPTAVRTLKLQKTQRKDKLAAIKGMRTMGITGPGEDPRSSKSASSSKSGYTPPTITNIYKETMAAAGVDIKAKGYWNVVKEASCRASCGQSCSAASTKAQKKEDESLTRERLGFMNKPELEAMCEKRGLDWKGNKEELVNRLSIYAMQKMGSKITQQAASARTVATDGLSKTDLLKMKVGDLEAQAKKMGFSKGYIEGCWKKDLVEAIDEKLSAKRQGAAKRTAPAESQKGSSKRLKTSGNGYSSVTGGFARTVAASRASARTQKGGKVAGKNAAKGTKRGRGQQAPLQRGELGFTDSGHDISGSPLHNFAWSRIILDEAHRIKGRTNSTAQASYALRTVPMGFRWCMTGTPLQNRVGELYSLVRFLEFRPYAFYYCKAKGCECERCTFMRERHCPTCGHNRMFHYSYFKSKISTPIIKYGYVGAGVEAFKRLREEVLQKVLLRRTKEQKKGDLKLPPLKITIRKDKLSTQERDFYESIYRQSQVNFGTYVSKGTVLHNYAHIFDLLTSLRRAVDHPYLIVYGNAAARHAVAGGPRQPTKACDTCGLCQDDIEEDDEESCVAKCGHIFHKECIQEYMREAPKTKSGKVGCPVCYTALTLLMDEEEEEDDDDGNSKTPMKKKQAKNVDETPAKRSRASPATPAKGSKELLALPAPPVVHVKAQKSVASSGSAGKAKSTTILQRFKAADFASSTKIEALLEEVMKMKKADNKNKALVFSQFGAMLELVEFRLKRAGLNCVMFRGGMSVQARSDAIAAFNTDPSLSVILISLKAGGEGLNLQAANYVFLLDPWWNPACELQAIQRAHRIGQTKEVRAIRLITSGTIEDKILQLQEKKQLVFDGTIGGSSSSIAKLTEQDLNFLFQS